LSEWSPRTVTAHSSSSWRLSRTPAVLSEDLEPRIDTYLPMRDGLARAGLVAIDERRGRLVAREMGLVVTGSLGVLLRAKRLGFIDAVGPRVAAMRRHGIWLGDALVRRVLAEAQEPAALLVEEP
jgi:hypothetical protein